MVIMQHYSNHRHGSAESSQSTQSNDTIRASAGGFRGKRPARSTPVKVDTDNENLLTRKDSEISPGSAAPSRKPGPGHRPKTPSNPNDLASIAPWDAPAVPPSRNLDFNHRRDLSVLDNSGPKIPSISRIPPNAQSPPKSPSWDAHPGAPTDGPPILPAGEFGDFDWNANDLSQFSPGMKPGSGTHSRDEVDNRRPSIASATTVSSNHSKTSIGRSFHKRLHGVFGEDGEDATRSHSSLERGERERHGTLSGAMDILHRGHGHGRHRNNSTNNQHLNSFGSRPTSPTSSRPRTPMNVSEVTPWEFQDFGRGEPPGQIIYDNSNYNSDARSLKSTKSHHRLHFPGRRSKEDDKKFPAELAPPFGMRPVTSREDSVSSFRSGFPGGNTSMTSALNSKSQLSGRSSPTPSSSSGPGFDLNMQQSPEQHRSKRGLLGKIRRKERGERNGGSAGSGESRLGRATSSTSLHSAFRMGSAPTSAPMSEDVPPVPSVPKSVQKAKREASAERDGNRPRKQSHSGKEHHRFPFFRGKHWHHDAPPVGKDPNEARADEVGNDAVWLLDTDLTHMEGIVDTNQPPKTPPQGYGDIFSGPNEESQGTALKEKDPNKGAAAWDAPDSWAVKRINDENVSRLREFDEEGGMMTEENLGPPYCVRIFRQDSTMAVLSVPLNTSVAEIIQILGKKTFLQDGLDNYHILMRKHDTSRQLEPQERPVVIQKKLLLQAGYNESDRLEDVGREDNSYLCRFTFLPAKITGYSSLDRDPGFDRMQKFTHVDLSGRNLITIPIALYQKATDIQTLNLSRNLSLDVPKDFIQACISLREIRYTGNEAWRLPPSLSLATRLTSLDISNNHLKQLEHADLFKLNNLISLRLSNNQLTYLPKYFGQFQALRSLNLSSNYITQFPEFIGDIKTLKDLDVSFNAISELPNIGRLTNLERLWATNNRLVGAFPPTFWNLVNLREIDVRFNAINKIDHLTQLPNLEILMIGHNLISAFEGAFPKVRILHMNHNPVTRFNFSAPVPSLSTLNLASGKMAHLPDDLFGKVSGLTKLILDKNHLVSLSPQIGRLYRLEHLSIARNPLNNLPAEIGRLGELRYLDVRENNLNSLPPEIWLARKLETLNVSSNVLDTFPKPGATLPSLPGEDLTPTQSHGSQSMATSPSFDELGKLENFQTRRASQASGFLSVASSPSSATTRKGSTASIYSTGPRKNSSISRTNTDVTMTSRKDSSYSNKLMMTFAGSLRYLYLADNRLSDEVFEELAKLSELRTLNISYNLIYDLPPAALRRWQQLTELYLSGNDMSALPAEAFEDVSSLKVLHINGNKFLSLPAELGKVQKLAVLDVGCNALKYNVCNWPYDWNWNWNRNLKYLNLSGNKRLEIKPAGSASISRDGKDLTDFTSLPTLRVLGLMDVTLLVPSSIPDQTENRRIRTAGSTIGSMAYGMADALGRQENLSTMDMLVPKFRSHEDETLVGMFDGQSPSAGGSKIAKFLYDNFKHRFAEEIENLATGETPEDALRRTYLGLNKDLASMATQKSEMKGPDPMAQHRPSVISHDFTDEDANLGSTATVLYMKELELFVSNVGDCQALLIHSEGGHKIITRKHDPAEPSERQRIRDAGGYVSRQGKLNDVLDVSRAFGYVHMAPAVIASPTINQITIRDSDEMILIASRELWDYMTPDFAVDVARGERNDLMRAAQKLRDLALAFGATGKITVMIVGVSDLRKRERARFRTHSMSIGPSGTPDEFFGRRNKRDRQDVADSKLARLGKEVDAPTGDVSLVFTDIKNSTVLWENFPIAMRSAIKMHNELMRRHLRIIGGYEVKTEGDAFMVAFPTVTSALLWSFTIQSQLLEVQWPQEILDSASGGEVSDADGNVIFRGLSVRMGIHWGAPVCEVDPVTKRMDYFGPMVNRAARIESVADGGQITVSSDFIGEVQRLFETHIESDRSASTGSEDTINDDMLTHAIRRELRSLSSQGFEVKDLGERRLKGLENPEYIYLMYPHSLASRFELQQQKAAADAAKEKSDASSPRDGLIHVSGGGSFTIDTEHVYKLWNVSLRLEMLCSTLEDPSSKALKPPETALLEKTRRLGGEITDQFLLNFIEHQVSRIESCINTLALRNMVRPFKDGLINQCCPMQEIFADLTQQLAELKQYKEEQGVIMAPSQGCQSYTSSSTSVSYATAVTSSRPHRDPFPTPVQQSVPLPLAALLSMPTQRRLTTPLTPYSPSTSGSQSEYFPIPDTITDVGHGDDGEPDLS